MKLAIAHSYASPYGDCTICAAEWPCEPARTELLDQHPIRKDLLRIMVRVYADALTEIGEPWPPTGILHNRYLAWTTRTQPERRLSGTTHSDGVDSHGAHCRTHPGAGTPACPRTRPTP
jgi:hypothetical protein